MKYLYMLLFSFVLFGCDNAQKDRYTPNDTIKCVVSYKETITEYDPVIQRYFLKNCVKLTTKDNKTINIPELYYNVIEGDSVNCIVQYYPKRIVYFETIK